MIPDALKSSMSFSAKSSLLLADDLMKAQGTLSPKYPLARPKFLAFK
jgi:hypothetical protein